MKLHNPPKLKGKYLDKVLASGWYTTGPWNDRLKEKIAEEVSWNERKIVLASSATAAFHAIRDYIDWKLAPEADWYITDCTWPGITEVVAPLYRRDYDDAEVIVLTDIGGKGTIDPVFSASDVDPGREAIVVHDVCHSWMPDRQARFSFASFYPTKLVPGAEGGVIFCQFEEDVERLERLLYCGLKAGGGVNTVQEWEGRGWARKANMTDIQAALNYEALDLSYSYIRQVAARFDMLATEARSRGLVYRLQNIRPYLFQLYVGADRIPLIRERLLDRNIPSAWNFPPAGLLTLPIHLNPARLGEVQGCLV